MGSVKKAVGRTVGSVTGGGAPKVKAPEPVAQVAEVTQENQGGGSMGYGGGATMAQGSSSQSNILDPIEATTDEEKEILG